MRIAVIHSFYRSAVTSGENNTVIAQVEALRGAGQEVELIAQYTDENRRRNPLYPLKAGFDVATGSGYDPIPVLEKFQPDVVWVHNLFPNFSTRWLAKWRGPLIATLHNYRPVCANGVLFRDGHVCTLCPDGKPLSALKFGCYKDSRLASIPLTFQISRGLGANPLITRADRIVVVSSDSSEAFENFGIKKEKIWILPSFAKINNNQKKPAPQSGRWVVAARLSPEKGVKKLVEQWPSEFQLDIYGDGEERAAIEAIVKPNVRLMGHVPPEDLARALPGYVGMVFPSLSRETQGLAAAEALHANLAVVARANTAVARLISIHNLGKVYGDGNQSLRNALNEALAKPFELTQMEEAFPSQKTWLEGANALLRSVVSSAPAVGLTAQQGRIAWADHDLTARHTRVRKSVRKLYSNVLRSARPVHPSFNRESFIERLSAAIAPYSRDKEAVSLTSLTSIMRLERTSLSEMRGGKPRPSEFNSVPAAIGKITFVIPTYQRVWEAMKAIAGVYELRLRPSEFEVRVVDNASTDELADVCIYLQSVLPNFSLHRWPQNAGAIENWRRGIEASSSDWIKMVFSDDSVTPGFLNALNQRVDWSAVGGLVGGALVVTATGLMRRRYHGLGQARWLTPQSAISALLSLPAGLPVSPSAGFGRRDIYLQALNMPYRDELVSSAMGPDLVMNFLPLMQERPLRYDPGPIAELVGGPTSITVQTNRYVRYGRYAEAILLMCDCTDVAIPARDQQELLRRAEFQENHFRKSPVVGRVRKFSKDQMFSQSRIVTDGFLRPYRHRNE